VNPVPGVVLRMGRPTLAGRGVVATVPGMRTAEVSRMTVPQARGPVHARGRTVRKAPLQRD